MRITAGEFRSRQLKTPRGHSLRPTPDILRQALFNVLGPTVEGCVFVDAYAGTGAVGLEALSRGAARAVFLEKHHRGVELIRENLRALGIEDRATVAAGPAASLLERFPGDIVFLDPPYLHPNEYELSLSALGEQPPPLVVVQHDRRQRLRDHYGVLHRTRTLTHGDNSLTFYRPPAEPQPGFVATQI